MAETNKPVTNSSIVFREEFDDWAVLFDPDSGEAYGLDPVGVFIWKRFDGNHTPEDILNELREECEDGIPAEASDHIAAFIEDLSQKGLIGSAVK